MQGKFFKKVRVNEIIQPLLQLQALENSVLDIQKQRELCAKNLRSLQELKQKAEEALKDSESQLVTKKRDYQAQELELNHLEDLLVQQKAKRLFVKKAEEFNALEEANKRIEQQISDLQDRMLSDLEGIEAQEKLTQAQKTEYETQVRQWNEQTSALKQQNEVLVIRWEEAQKRQEAYESRLQGPYYQAYVNLRKCDKAMPRVVPVKEDGKCGGCFLALSREAMDQLQKEGVQFCEHCGRILYKLDI